MKIYRLFVDVVMFAGGAAAGVYWGVNHPFQAADIAQREHMQALKIEIAADQAKVEVLKRFGGDSAAAQQAMADAQKKLDDANQQLASQPAPQN